MNIRLVLSAAALLSAAGCVAIPYRDDRTPSVSGRVVDASSQTGLAGARIAFLDHEQRPLSRPTATTDAAGRFTVTHSFNYYVGAHIAAHAMAGFPPGVESSLLQVTRPPYRTRILDVDAVGQAQHLKDQFWQSPQSRFHSVGYNGTISLGEILMTR